MSGLLESLGRSGFRLAPAAPIRPLYVENARQQIELLFSNVEAKKPAEFDLTQAWRLCSQLSATGTTCAASIDGHCAMVPG